MGHYRAGRYPRLKGDAMPTLQPYRDFAPTPFDPAGAFLHDERADWLIAPCAHNRDSDCLTESNWSAQLAALGETGPEGDNWQVHQFGHWGPGWFELALVRPGTPAETVALELAGRLEDYPILDEDDYSAGEAENAEEAWDWLDMRDRVAMLAKNGESIFAARAKGADLYDRAPQTFYAVQEQGR